MRVFKLLKIVKLAASYPQIGFKIFTKLDKMPKPLDFRFYFRFRYLRGAESHCFLGNNNSRES